MNFNLIAGAATTVALFLPVFLLAAGRLLKNGPLLALFTYYLLTAVYNLLALDVIALPLPVLQQAAIGFNYLETPLMLLVLLFFCNEPWKCRMVSIALILFLIFEIFIAFRFGLDIKSSLYLLGPGTLLIFGFSLFFFSHYGKVSVVQGKGTGKTLMLVAILFAYVCFLTIYYLQYLMQTSAVADVFLIYYIGIFISSVIMSTGLVWIIKRSRKIKELQLTRRELALFFDN